MEKLTKAIAYEALGDFFKEKPFVLFATGVSCALDRAFGMGALQDHLTAKLVNLEAVQQQQWDRVVRQLEAKSCDFEAAMDQVKDEALVKQIVDLTAEFVGTIDRRHETPLLTGASEWPVAKLFKCLFNALSAGQSLDVATPNYDLLAEYAFSQMDIPYLTGFVGGYCRQLDWKKAQRSMLVRQNKRVGRSMKSSFYVEKHLRLYKPHGSLNTFELNNRIIECDGWREQLPNSNHEGKSDDKSERIVRFMVTPGTSKYKKLHDISESLDAYRAAVKNHGAFLFLGFGFNDSHLVNGIFREKLQTEHCPALVITRDCDDKMMGWAKKSANLWLVCKQEDNEFTRIYNKDYVDWLLLDDEQLWHFNQFAERILGA